MNYNSSNSKKVVVAMSGGVDSSTAALLLKEKGYEVIGLTALMHDEENAEQAVINSAEVCKKLDIPHETADLRTIFKDTVINYFENSYKTGLTPNPCTFCNKKIKWGKLRDYANDKIGAEYFATGHYARIVQTDDKYKLLHALDSRKDQIYMLCRLTQSDLAHTLFPLSGLTKQEVREIALKNNLPCAASKESQDVCFIQPPDSTKKYLSRIFGDKPGNFIDINTNKILGKHDGAYKYTIGQRKGIGIAAKEPLYVISTDPDINTVYIGFEKDLYQPELIVTDVNWQQEEYNGKRFRAFVKIRYNSPAKPAEVIPQENNTAHVSFDEPQSAITPGQVAVFYDINNEYLIGGGWIG